MTKRKATPDLVIARSSIKVDGLTSDSWRRRLDKQKEIIEKNLGGVYVEVYGKTYPSEYDYPARAMGAGIHHFHYLRSKHLLYNTFLGDHLQHVNVITDEAYAKPAYPVHVCLEGFIPAIKERLDWYVWACIPYDVYEELQREGTATPVMLTTTEEEFLNVHR